MKINERSSEFSLSGGLYDIYNKALEMESEGRKIVHMEIGRPDFDSPEIAKNAVKVALDKGDVHYTPVPGTIELRKAVADKYRRDHGISYKAESEVMISAGAAESLMTIMLTLMDPGDEIIVPSPFFSAYLEQAIIAGVNLVEVPLKMENNFSLKASDIEKAVTEKTKIILITTPHNPTGAIITRSDLEEIGDIAKKHDLIVVSDETYDQFLFEGKHCSIASLEGMRERTIIVNSASKVFSMTGWRIGYLMAPSHVIPYLSKVHQNLSTCATSFAQAGATKAYNEGDDFVANMLDEFKNRRDYIYKRLSKIDGLEVVEPKGAFYIFPNISKLKMDETEFCNYILDEAGVAIVPGGSFGKYGQGFVRICYACSMKDIEYAMDKLELAIKNLKLEKI